MQNKDIRNEIKASGLKLWQVAYALNMRDNAFSVSLRRELPEPEKARIREIIAQLVKEREEVA